MKLKCPSCHLYPRYLRTTDFQIAKAGSYYRSSDRKRVQRYLCYRCKAHFSSATLHDCYKQKKRQCNSKVARVLVAGVSLRESARVLKLNRKTIARKMKFMAKRARKDLTALNYNLPIAKSIQFDDMETFVHSKCKPVSISMAVEKDTRRILGFEVAEMPCKGRLASKSLNKYGPRKDLRPQARAELFYYIKPFISPYAEIMSDENPHYPKDIKIHFPTCTHLRFKGGRSAATGQGELKKVGFDPLFSFNHTAAMVRYRLSRMIRKTWSTSKKTEAIRDHLALMAAFHNRMVIHLPAG